MAEIVLDGIRKVYGSVTAVDSVDLRIQSHELFFLLGPSGCGKTTLLRILAGLVTPDSGRVLLDGQDITRLAPERREMAMVFQNYALWPHLTVAENVGYGLRVRHVSRAERETRIQEALRRVRIEGLGSRMPGDLSGGQQQRAALARALVVRPRVLLLDEPLSNLDARLRLELRELIREVCAESRITTVYVTHDQEEALSLASRIAILRAGQVMQVGTPRAVYARPRSRFVAEFLGDTNFLPATVVSATDGRVVLETAYGLLESSAFDETTPRGGNVTISIRPEAFRIARSDDRTNVLPGTRRHSHFLGHVARHSIELADGTAIRVTEINPQWDAHLAPGEPMPLAVDSSDIVLLPD